MSPDSGDLSGHYENDACQTRYQTFPDVTLSLRTRYIRVYILIMYVDSVFICFDRVQQKKQKKNNKLRLLRGV